MGNFNVLIFLSLWSSLCFSFAAGLLSLACQVATQLVTVLDYEEIYVQEEPINLNMLREISAFLNQFVFNSLWKRKQAEAAVTASANKSGYQTLSTSAPLRDAQHLLSVIYDQDCRQRFTAADHWLIKNPSTREFEVVLDKERAARLAGKPMEYERAQQVCFLYYI